MTKPTALLLCLLAFSAAVAPAQTAPISSIQISTVPDGARFYVDGQVYYASQTFLWPQGSKHLVQFPLQIIDGVAQTYQESLDGGVRYTFGGWTDNKGLLTTGSSPTQVITADPTVTFLRASVSLQYRVSLRFSNSPTAPPLCGGAPGNAPQDQLRSGIVYVVGGTAPCYGSDADLWLPAGNVTVSAFPFPGWVFTGWYVNGQSFPSYLSSIPIAGPVTLRPVFILGKRVQFVTEPWGMQLIIDRTPTPTSANQVVDGSILQTGPNALPCDASLTLPPLAPRGLPSLCLGEFDFIPGSQHTIAGVSPQYDRSGKLWVFDKFSNGLPQNSVWTAGTNTSVRDVITGTFVPGVQVAFLTDPPGLRLQVDGTDKWQSYNFVWAEGSTHTITAPATQVDSRGRRWTFKGWSNGGPATQTVNANLQTANNRLIATYAVQGQVQVTTTPPGVRLQIDGAECTSPCIVDREAGTEIAIAAPASIPQDSTSRLDLQGWSDNVSAGSRSYTFDSEASVIHAMYTTSYQLASASNPPSGVDLVFDPPSPDSYYTADTAVTVTAKPRPGFKFRRWGGDLSGTFPTVQFTVAGPRSIVAMLDRVPYIEPAGIRSAAGPTPDGSVAPGSIIAILGESLGPDYQEGPRNPLAQTIGGIIVTVADRILPLLFVSPNQINAQILSDLPDGEYTLRVQNATRDTITGQFRISRNAPGIFTRTVEGQQPVALALHEDGTPITADSPARKGEVISLYGTGFGPYDQPVIDGFLIPDPSNYQLIDPVEISANDVAILPQWTGAAPGRVGTALTRFKLSENVPAATNLDITVRVNGKPSNKVILPVE